MSPVFHREDGFCFRIFSNEESQKHIHVEKAGKRAKFWLEPSFELSENYGFTDREINKIFRMKDASIKDVLNVQMDGDYAIEWPTLDTAFEIDSLKHPEKYPFVMTPSND